jgi:hypothetical protein
MPLVVPGLMSNSNDKNDDWQNKLMGKKIGDTSDEVVCQPISAYNSYNLFPRTNLNSEQTFAKTELPKEHRVVKEGDMVTMDHKPDRYENLIILLSNSPANVWIASMFMLVMTERLQR